MYLEEPGIPQPLPAILRRSIILMELLDLQAKHIAGLFSISVAEYRSWLRQSSLQKEIQQKRQQGRKSPNQLAGELVVLLSVLNVPDTRMIVMLETTTCYFYWWLDWNGLRTAITQTLTSRNQRMCDLTIARQWSIERVARRFFLAVRTTEDIVKTNPGYRRLRQKQQRERRQRNDWMRQARRQGVPISTIAKQQRVSVALVRIVCKHVSPPPPAPKPAPRSMLETTVVQWRQKKHLARLIASFLGIKRASVYDALKHDRPQRRERIKHIRSLYNDPPWEDLIAKHLDRQPSDITPILQRLESAA